MIKVYDSNEKKFNNNGIKILKPLLAEIHKVDNGDYYIELEDILENINYYQKGIIIRVSTPWGVQGFRCDNPNVKNNRIISKAWHLTYDSQNYIISDKSAVNKNCNAALAYYNSNTDITSPFTTISDISTILTTRMVRKTLYDVFVDLIDKYNGHLYRDNWTFGIKQNIGQDRGVVLANNKNISDIATSENWDSVCTKILPYTTDGETSIMLDDIYVELEEQLYDIPYTKIVKFENIYIPDDFVSYEAFLSATKQWLFQVASEYLQENKVPKINYSVSAKIDNISDVGDTIYVKHSKCRVNITTHVISVIYDVIGKKYKKIEFGNFKKELKNLTKDIVNQANKQAEELVKENKTILENELSEATAEINAVLGNSYVIYDGDKILIVDSLPKETATHVIKISSGGIGFSSTGINGTFNSAWTINGTMNMQNFNVINFTASLIKGGVLTLGGEDNGIIEVYNDNGILIGKIDKDGIQFNVIDDLQRVTNNNYQEIISKFDGYTPTEDTVMLQESVSTLQTNTYSKIEVDTKLTDGSVTKVSTTSGTFDSNGLTIEKTNAKSKGRFNEKGVTVLDATGSTDTELLFAGFDEELNESIVRTRNLKVSKYLTIGQNSRIEDYENGTGIFVL